MAKLVGLLKSPTGNVHGLKDKDARTAYCGYKDKETGSIPYSGKSHITCGKCLKRLPEDIY